MIEWNRELYAYRPSPIACVNSIFISSTLDLTLDMCSDVVEHISNHMQQIICFDTSECVESDKTWQKGVTETANAMKLLHLIEKNENAHAFDRFHNYHTAKVCKNLKPRFPAQTASRSFYFHEMAAHFRTNQRKIPLQGKKPNAFLLLLSIRSSATKHLK